MLNPRLLTDDRLAAMLRTLRPHDPDYPCLAAEWTRRAEHARHRAAVASGTPAFAAPDHARGAVRAGRRRDATRPARRARRSAAS